MAESKEAQVERVQDVKQWTAKSPVVLDLIEGKTTAVDVARKHDLTVADVEGSVQRYLSAGEEAMRANPPDLEAQWGADRGQLHAKIKKGGQSPIS